MRTCTQNTATKTTGDGWTEQVYSTVGFTGAAYASARAGMNNRHVMFGLNSDPLTDASYPSIDYAMYFAVDGNVYTYESGVQVGGSLSAYAAGDLGEVVYSGTTVKYFLKGVLLRTATVSAGLTLYFDSSFYTSGVVLNDFHFGPTAVPLSTVFVASAGVTMTYGEDNVLNGSTFQTQHRLKIANGSGTMKDWSSWIEDVSTDENVDQPIAQLDIAIRRDVGPTGSLSPLRTDSPLNVLDDNVTFSPAIDVGRALTWEVATTPVGTAPVSADWKPLFVGNIDDFDFDQSPMKLTARDDGFDLADTWIEAVAAYPPSVSLESGIQRILDNVFGAGVKPLYTPVSPGYALNAYNQQVQSVATAVDALQQLIGWDTRYRWDNGTSSFRLTLSDPGRANTTPAYIFGPQRILSVKKLGFKKTSVRNVIIVSFKDQATGTRQTITVTDGTSITRYKRQVLLITEPDDSPINSSAQATTMANAALSDLKDPKADFEVEMLLWWPAMLNDLYRFTPNGRQFNTAQDLAVVGIRHHLSAPTGAQAYGEHRTTLTLRGKPTGGYDSWLNRRITIPTPIPNVPDYHGMFFSEVFDKTPLQQGWINGSSNTNGTLVGGIAHVGKNVYQMTKYEWWLAPLQLPFNPSKFYRFRVRYRATVNAGAGGGYVYMGFRCFDAAGNVTNTNGGYCYVGISGDVPLVSEGWKEISSYFKGATSAFGSGSTANSLDPLAPSTLSVNTSLIQPLFSLNYPGVNEGTFQIDYIAVEEFDDDASFRIYNMIDIAGKLKRAKPFDDNNFGHVSTTSDGLTLHTGALDAGLRIVRRFNAKSLVGDPDSLDGVVEGTTYKRVTTNAVDGSSNIDFSKSGFANKHLGYVADDAGSDRRAATANQKAGGDRAFASHDSSNRFKRANPFDDTYYGHVSTSGDGLTLHSGSVESGGKAVNRFFAKALSSSPDHADSVNNGISQRTIPFTILRNSDGALLSAIDRDAAFGGTPVRTAAKREGIFFTETWESAPSDIASAVWTGSGGTQSRVASGGNSMGGYVLQQLDYGVFYHPQAFPFNPTKLYRLRCRIRVTVDGAKVTYLGLIGLLADGSPANTNGGNNYCLVSGAGLTVANGWVIYTSYIQGASLAVGSAANGTFGVEAPSPLNVGTAYIKPMMLLNYNGTSAQVTQVDYFTIEELDEDISNRTAQTVTSGGNVKRGRAFDDTYYGHVSTTSDGLKLHSSAIDNGSRLVSKFNAKSLVADPDSLDGVIEGSTYKRVHNTSVNASGYPDMSKAGWANKNGSYLGRSSVDATGLDNVVQNVTNSGHAGSGMQESGGKAINRFLGKTLAGDADNFDGLPDGSITYRKITGVSSGLVQLASMAASSINASKVVADTLYDICYLTDNTGHTVNSSVAASFDWATSTEVLDAIDMHTAGFLSAIQVLTAHGLAIVYAKITWDSNTTGNRYIRITANFGGVVAEKKELASAVAGVDQTILYIEANPDAAQYYRVEVFQDSGANRTVTYKEFRVIHLKI